MAFRPRKKSSRKAKYTRCKKCGGGLKKRVFRCKKCSEVAR